MSKAILDQATRRLVQGNPFPRGEAFELAPHGGIEAEARQPVADPLDSTVPIVTGHPGHGSFQLEFAAQKMKAQRTSVV